LTLIADVPITVLSVIADQLRLDELQAFAKVPKPFDFEQLVSRAAGLLLGR
jgi:hypothetical protein